MSPGMKAKIKSGQYTFPSPEWDCVSEAGDCNLFKLFDADFFPIFTYLSTFSKRSYQEVVENWCGGENHYRSDDASQMDNSLPEGVFEHTYLSFSYRLVDICISFERVSIFRFPTLLFLPAVFWLTRKLSGEKCRCGSSTNMPFIFSYSKKESLKE